MVLVSVETMQVMPMALEWAQTMQSAPTTEKQKDQTMQVTLTVMWLVVMILVLSMVMEMVQTTLVTSMVME
jgi:hypothetical protein